MCSPIQRGAGRPPSRGPGTHGPSGPTATLYALAFYPWGSREEDRRQEFRDEGSESPATTHSSSNSNSSGTTRKRDKAPTGRLGGTVGGGHGSSTLRRPRPALALTRDMCATYSTRNPLFRFTPNVPKRVLTVPSEGAGNDGLDNIEFNLIARVNDVLEAPGTSYSVLDLLGQGTFGQVFRCQDHATKDIVAIKVVKNKPAYRNQALLEIQVAKLVRDCFSNFVTLITCNCMMPSRIYEYYRVLVHETRSIYYILYVRSIIRVQSTPKYFVYIYHGLHTKYSFTCIIELVQHVGVYSRDSAAIQSSFSFLCISEGFSSSTRLQEHSSN